jgi:hypothetical protein
MQPPRRDAKLIVDPIPGKKKKIVISNPNPGKKPVKLNPVARPVGRPGAGPMPSKTNKPVAPMVMNTDSKILAKFPVTQAHLNSIKKYYGIKQK